VHPPRPLQGFFLTPSPLVRSVAMDMKASSQKTGDGWRPGLPSGCNTREDSHEPGGSGPPEKPLPTNGDGDCHEPGACDERRTNYSGGEEDGEDDEVLLTRMRAGDTVALSRLWRRYAALLYTQAHAVLHNSAESEDVVAEMFVEVWQRVENYHPERARPVAWLVTLVRRRAIDKLRERRSYESAGARMARECSLAKQYGGGSCGTGTDSALEQMRLSELRALLEGALGQLPPNQRETVSMVYFLGLTQKEIAARTRTPLGTVKTRLELGLRKMRERIRGTRLLSALRARAGP